MIPTPTSRLPIDVYSMRQQERAYTRLFCFFFSSRRRHTRLQGDWSSDVCSSDLGGALGVLGVQVQGGRVHGEGAEQQVVRLGHGAPHQVLEALPYGELLEIKSRQDRKSVV